MEKKVSQIEESKHFSGSRTVVTFDEKKRWIELWPDVRKRVRSNSEAFKQLEGLGIRFRDARTIKSHLEKLLPLINTNAISAVIDLTNYFESHLPAKELMQLIKERLPAEELGTMVANFAEVFIKEAAPPAQVIQALGSVLTGGFPWGDRREKK